MKNQDTRTSDASNGSFTKEERAAMRERAKEMKALANKEMGEGDILAKIAEMPPSDRSIAEAIHAIVKKVAPDLAPRTWYGMPAYSKDGNVVLFFQSAEKFKSRYATLGFNGEAKLDDGNMWPTYFAVKKLTAVEEARITDLVKKAIQ